MGERLRGAGALGGETVAPQPPRERAVNALRVHYRCRDGRWLLLSIASDEWRWDRFKRVLAAPALDDPRFATVAAREAHAGELLAVLDKAFALRDLAEWRALLDEAGIVFGTVAVMEDIAGDRQMRDSGALVPYTDGGLTVSSPIFIAGEEKVTPRRAPELGEHSDRVLRNAGYGEAEIRALREAGIIS